MAERAMVWGEPKEASTPHQRKKGPLEALLKVEGTLLYPLQPLRS